MIGIAHVSRVFALTLALLLMLGLAPQNKARAQSPFAYCTNFKFDVNYTYDFNVQDTFTLTCEIDGSANSAVFATTPHINIQYYDDNGNPLGPVYQSAFEFEETETTYVKQQSGNVIAALAGRGDSCQGYYLAWYTHPPRQSPKSVIYWYSMDVGVSDGNGHGTPYTVTSPTSKLILLR